MPSSNICCYANHTVAAYEDFLSSFKMSASATEASARSALEGLNFEEDDLSDEYDFMDDAAGQNRGASRQGDPKKKYMEILQKVADRELNEICIELDDLDAVRYLALSSDFSYSTHSTKKASEMMSD